MTYIIAEAGVNHRGDLDKALALVDAAKKSGADCVKFQMFWTSGLVDKERDRDQWETLRKVEIDEEDVFPRIHDACAESGIDFLATPFTLRDMTEYQNIGVRAVKIASPDLHWTEGLQFAGCNFDHVILSTGASYPEQITHALSLIGDRAHVTLLHCVSAYPAPIEETNLMAMTTLARKFPQCDIGFSDHSQGYRVAVAACAMGAAVLEKHLMLERGCPDEAVSLFPGEFADMVQSIRLVEKAMGDGVKRPMPSEIPGIARSRRGNDGLRPMVPHV